MNIRVNQEKDLPHGYRVITDREAMGIWSLHGRHESHEENGLAVSGLMSKMAVLDPLIVGYMERTDPDYNTPDPKSGWFVLDTATDEIEHSMSRSAFDARLAELGVDVTSIDFVTVHSFDDSKYKHENKPPAP